MTEFKSFYKTVGGNEGGKCYYPTRLDTYGCGCSHDCSYCYSKSLLNFRKLWNPKEPAIADIKKIERVIKKIENKTPIRLGGMTDCFQACEKKYHVTYETIKILNKYQIPYLIVTKSPLVATDEYMEILDKKLAHIQISVTATDTKKVHEFEKSPSIESRIQAIEKLYTNGFDVCIRISPYVPQFIDQEVIKNVKCKKILVEFLRVNTWIKKWFDIDFSEYTLKHGGYQHLPLEKKIEYLKKLECPDKIITVCEDEDTAYQYWKENYNPNPNDCCNLEKR